jgi:putative aldouronate transport system permease protein
MKKEINSISRVTNVILNIIFILAAAACILPIFLVAGISLTDEDSIMKFGYSIIPKVVSFKAYDFIYKVKGMVLDAYVLTILVTLTGTILSTLITTMYAYCISRKEFVYRKFFTYYLLFTMIFNGGMVPWYIVCVKLLHINNNVLALLLPYLINGFYVIIMRTFIVTNVPDSIIESARIDGSGEIKTFFRIVVPLAVPGIATIALFTTLVYWNDWWIPLMLITDSKLYNLQYLLYKLMNNIETLARLSSNLSGSSSEYSNLPSQGARMAMCIISIGPIVLAYPFFQKYFVKGLTIGSVKG